MVRRKSNKRTRSKVEVKIKAPIQPFGFFTFREFGSATKEVREIESRPIYVFPKSTAAIAEV